MDYRTKEEQVADYLRERIISGVFPRGSRLKQAEIADQLKLSITPVREALKLLVAEDIPIEALQTAEDKVAIPPLVGALLKNEQDVTLFEKLVFMQSRNR